MPSADAPCRDGDPTTGDGLSRFLGLRWGPAADVVRLTVRPDLVNSAGLLLGPVAFAIVDYSMAAALWRRTGSEEWIATAETSISYLQSTTAGEVWCRSWLDRRSKRLGMLRSELRHEDGRLLATASAVFSIRPSAPPA